MTAAIVVAAGRGMRMGGPVPKQYRQLDGMPVIRHTLLAFLRHPDIRDVRAVIHPSDLALFAEAVAGLGLPEPVMGGGTRQESVRFGLESLAAVRPAKVIIHDGVRPFVEQATISNVIAALDDVPAVITGVPVPDTLKRCRDGIVNDTVDRTGVWRAQTPQGFHFDKILKAHADIHFADPASADLTDDSLVIERAGLPVALIEGSDDNFKITTERDLARAELVIRRGRLEHHVGWGFDFAADAPGEGLPVCGMAIAHHRGVAGNADVALRALTDAVLATAGGVAGASSLDEALALVAMRGGRIVHVDLTILAVVPDIAPHAAGIAARVGRLLSIEPARISVKQTVAALPTGVASQGDGLGAQCVVTAQYPGV